MHLFDSFLPLLITRAQLLVLVLPPAFLIGDVWGPLNINIPGARYLARKLDRPNRSAGTRVYRGMIAVGFLLLLTVTFARLLDSFHSGRDGISAVILFITFGTALGSLHLWRAWRAAQAHTLPLELPDQPYLFGDSHAVLRFLILTSGEQFATYVVGTSVWYSLGGLSCVLPYLLLARLKTEFHTPLFGWAAQALFRLVDALPRMLSWVLLLIAACFVPHAHPLAARHARSFQGLLAYILGISLGGTLPQRELPWVGHGTPKLLPAHLLRWMLLRLVATVVLLLTCAASTIDKLLPLFI